ncbi:hypothetical protein MNBD_ALPHA07-2322 [hydrothermal vent metagenome]|uniref:Uncharacterized protein n=1 Tax=hydrothermal vent metagenome TaxID=652676 RepID=A0A3B0RL00_9ZZZZ
MRIGVILNHFEPHQVPHVTPFAFALSRLRPGWTVDILCSTRAEMDFAREIATRFDGHQVNILRLKVPLLFHLSDPLLRQFTFARKVAVLRANLRRLSQYNALIMPEMTSLALRRSPQMQGVKMIFTGHGAGDLYDNPFGMFDQRVDTFDLVLLQGRRIARAMAAEGRLQQTCHAVIGYPKYEAVPQTPLRLFDDDRPVIVYNPTQNPRGSSWHKFGTEILDRLAARDDLNVIFAPHALLFKRSWTRGARLPKRFRNHPRLKIDPGSRASSDMTYLRAADLYLGDQSSQVYEFINRPRPCVFLNPDGANWQGNPSYRSWTFGPVVDRMADFDAALDAALTDFDRWQPAQQAALEDDAIAQDAPFAKAPASERGARAIAEFIEQGNIPECWK